jgi:hypothetical protein
VTDRGAMGVDLIELNFISGDFMDLVCQFIEFGAIHLYKMLGVWWDHPETKVAVHLSDLHGYKWYSGQE